MRALTSPSHLILSFSLFTSTKEATKSLPSSLLVVLVVHHRRLLTEKQRPFIARQRPLSAIYGSSKALNEGQSVSSKGERRQGSKGGQKISCPLRTPILCNFDRFTISTKCYPSSSERALLCVFRKGHHCHIQHNLLTDINPHLCVCSESGLSQLVFSVETIVSATDP